MKKIMMLVVMFGLLGCTDESEAKRVLDDAGFTQVTITGYKPFSCSKDDAFSTGFKAVNVNGKVVSGTVCSGLVFKNSTIRF